MNPWIETVTGYAVNVIEFLVIVFIAFLGAKVSKWLTNSVVGKKITTFVLAAEKLKETGEIGDKFSYVTSMLAKEGIEIITPEIRAMIEAAVKRIDLERKSDTTDKDPK